MMNTKTVQTTFLVTLLTLGSVPLAMAGAGHEHPEVPGSSSSSSSDADGPIAITETNARNLDLQLEEAQITEMAPTTTFLARLTLPPENHAKITTRTEGSVTRIDVKLGQDVEKGQTLMEVTPRAVGTKPYEILSPIAGVVLSLDVAPGQGFGQETVLIQVADLSSLLVEGTVFQRPELFQLEPGQPITFYPDADPSLEVEGTLDRMEVSLEMESKTLKVYGIIPNPDQKLRPNMTGRMEVSLGEAQLVIAAPASAILGELGNLFLFVEAGEPLLYERREVEIGMRSKGLVDVISGLSPGEKVVTQGNYQLQYVTPQSGASFEEIHGHAH